MSFQREERYLVIKIKDARKYLHIMDQHQLDEIAQRVDRGRFGDGKAPLECCCVESSWPEYEPTWAAIKNRVERSAELEKNTAEKIKTKLLSMGFSNHDAEIQYINETFGL